MLKLFVEPEGRVRLGHVILAHASERALIQTYRGSSVSANLVRDVLHVVRVVKRIHQVHVRLHADCLLVVVLRLVL